MRERGAGKRNVVVMVEELKGVAGSGRGVGREGLGETGVIEGKRSIVCEGGKKKKQSWSGTFSCGCACGVELGLTHVTLRDHRPGWSLGW